jgi:hypothetical protein
MQMKKIMDILFDKFSDSLNDKETVDKLNLKIFNPIVNNIFLQIYPYFIFFSVIIISLFVLLFSILFLNIKGLYK